MLTTTPPRPRAACAACATVGGLHTTGHYNVKAVLDHLANTTAFKHADNLLLSGGSAGGIGVFHNADFVGDYIKT